jgi:hypothetical protein
MKFFADPPIWGGRRTAVQQFVSYAVLTVSLIAPVGAARVVLGVVMAGLARRRP